MHMAIITACLLLQNVYFSTARDEPLRSDVATVRTNAQWMKDNPDKIVILEGHCDERGSRKYNLRLGDRRVRRVKELMIENGADEGKLAIMSYGEERPVDTEHNEKAWRKNRRVEFVLGN